MSFLRLDNTSYSGSNIGAVIVAVVGVGTLGSELARLLGLIGVGTVVIIDNDTVEHVNISQNIFFREPEALGRPKAEVIARKSSFYFSRTRWVALRNEIADVGLNKLASCSIIFCATDSALSRVECAYAARRLGIPMLDIGLLGSLYWRGRAAWFSSNRDAACYFCQLSENRRAEILALSHSPTLSCRWNEENVNMPSTPMMASVVAGMAIDMALRHGLSDGDESSFAWDIELDSDPHIRKQILMRSSTCPFHEFADRNTLIPLPLNLPFRESLSQQQVKTIEFDWPIAIDAACHHCGHNWKPMRRLAWTRRHAHCPKCGQTNYLRIQAISRVSAEDICAQYSPSDLSFSEDHLYTPVYQEQ